MPAPPSAGMMVTESVLMEHTGAFLPNDVAAVCRTAWNFPEHCFEVFLVARVLSVESPIVIAKQMIQDGWSLNRLPHPSADDPKRKIRVRVDGEDVDYAACEDDLELMRFAKIPFRRVS